MYKLNYFYVLSFREKIQSLYLDLTLGIKVRLFTFVMVKRLVIGKCACNEKKNIPLDDVRCLFSNNDLFKVQFLSFSVRPLFFSKTIEVET